MDRKSIAVVVVCLLLMFFLRTVIDRMFPPIPIPVSTNQVAGITNTLASGTNQAAMPAATGSNGTAILSTTAPGAAKLVVSADIPEELLVVSNENARYTFTSRGGGLKQVELLDYRESVTARRKQVGPTNKVASLNSPSAPPVLGILWDAAFQGDGVFKLTPLKNGVRAEKMLSNGLTVTKDFVLSTNYLVTATVRLKNESAKALTLPPQQWVAGTATPMGPQDNGQAVSVLWYDGAKTASADLLSYFSTNTTKLFILPRTPNTEYRAGSNNVAWSAVQNQFFALALMPQKPAADVLVQAVNLPALSAEERAAYPSAVPNPRGLETTLSYPGLALDAGQTVTNEFNLFAGPKEYYTLNEVSDGLKNRIDLVMGFGGWFGPISKGLLVTMIWMHHSLHLGYGLAIILFTLALRGLIWPLTQKSMRSMKRMQALQPQLKAMQEKYKDDPQKLQQKTWDFYKKNKVNPLGGCLPMLLQMPIFFGFFGMLRGAIELRGEPFLWIADLSQPDTIGFLPGFNFPINPMPLIMGASQFWQASMTPPSPGMDPAQQKMMKYLPLIMVLFLYNYSAGLALYWTVSNLLTVLQTRLTRTQPAPAAAATPVAPQKKKN